MMKGTQLSPTTIPMLAKLPKLQQFINAQEYKSRIASCNFEWFGLDFPTTDEIPTTQSYNDHITQNHSNNCLTKMNPIYAAAGFNSSAIVMDHQLYITTNKGKLIQHISTDCFLFNIY